MSERVRTKHASVAGVTEKPERTRRERNLVLSSDMSDGSASPRLVQGLISRSLTVSQTADPYAPYYCQMQPGGERQILEPEYNFLDLLVLPEMNSTLRPCIDAMVVNTALTGYSLEYIGPENKQDKERAQEEKQRILGLMEFPNGDEPYIHLREKLAKEYETIGWSIMEVVRDTEGEVSSFHYIPAHSIRITTQDKEFTVVTSWRLVGGKYKSFTYRKRFRRYVQVINGNQKIFFKEFGDPRPILMENGDVAPSGTPVSELANELVINGIFVPGHIYPQPRYLPQIPAILGSREAELTNLHFFKDNAIPAMAILVSGGYLTEETVKSLRERWGKDKGRRMMNKVLIIEAQVDEETRELSDGPPDAPKLDFKPLAQERQQDAQFLEYDKTNANKIRSSFRLPPIFIGLTEDYTRATATASLELAENQVFVPERIKFDSIFNTTILTTKGGKPPEFWRMRTNATKVVGATTLSETLTRLEKIGAITPNVAIELTKQMLNMDIEKIAGDWGDMPFEFTKTLLKNGNMDLEGNFLKESLKTKPEPAGGKPKPTVKKEEGSEEEGSTEE